MTTEHTRQAAPSCAGNAGNAENYAAARLRLLQQGAERGPLRRAALAARTDEWLAVLWGEAAEPGAALVAVGGYGRGALSPRSDLDLLLLHDGTERGRIAALADRIWYPIWDLGLDLDHAVRTPAEVRRAAADDLRVQLGLLDLRHLAGDAELTARVRTAAREQWRTDAPRRLPQLAELAAERARRHGDLRYLLEPDLKEARGGLRDITALRAVAASWLADAPRAGLAEAHTHLLDVRDALHLSTGRATDRLALQDQPQTAHALELPDGDALLRTVYEAARGISYAGEVTWREVGRVLRARSGSSRARGPRAGSAGVGSSTAVGRTARGTGGALGATGQRTPLADGVVVHEGEAALARSARPDRDPVLALRAAAAAARAGLPLAPAAARRLAAVAPQLPVPWPQTAREELVTLLGAGEATVPVWEALEAEGLVTALLPEWAAVRCLPQHNPVHLYTVDRHLVETAVQAAAFTRRVHRPDLLLVAALAHDLGKGHPGDHAVLGAPLAQRLALRVGFGGDDAACLATLVRHHLLLIETATRRELDDPATARAVADAVGSVGTLELLHALTEADARATGPGAWSAWRARLVADLVTRTRALLAGAHSPRPSAPQPSAAAKRLASEAQRTGGPVLALQARAESAPGEHGDDGSGEGGEAEPEPVGIELLVAVPEQPGVLPCVAGVLALHRLAVRAAELRRLALPAGPADAHEALCRVLLLTWRVATEYGALPQADRLRVDLHRALAGTLDVGFRLAEREAAQRRRPAAPAPPPVVTVAEVESDVATVLEVRAPDGPGLLHRIACALEDGAVRVRSAHVSTLGANAVDAFYLTDPEGAPLPRPAAHALADALQQALT